MKTIYLALAVTIAAPATDALAFAVIGGENTLEVDLTGCQPYSAVLTLTRSGESPFTEPLYQNYDGYASAGMYTVYCSTQPGGAYFGQALVSGQ